VFLQSPTQQFLSADKGQELPLGIRNPLWGWYREGKSIVKLIKLFYYLLIKLLPAYKIVIPAYKIVYWWVIVGTIDWRLSMESLENNRITTTSWLTTAQVEQYFKMIEESSKNTIFLSPYFMQSILNVNLTAPMSTPDNMNEKNIFIAINPKDHWVLAYVQPQMGTISIYDSMSDMIDQQLDEMIEKLAIYMKLRIFQKFNIKKEKCNQQDNSNDCGLFMLAHARKLANNEPTMEVKQSLMAEYRQIIQSELENSCLQDYFP